MSPGRLQARIDELFLRHYELVVRIARAYAPDADLAWDVVQQVYLEFSHGAKTKNWDPDSDMAALLNRMTQTIGTRYWKERRKIKPKHIQVLEDLLRRKYEEQENRRRDTGYEEREIAALKECMAKLPEKSRELIDMRYQMEMPTSEIASIMNVQQRSVQQIIRRIRHKVRQCILFTLQKTRLS